MKQPGLDKRHRDTDGEIHKKRSDAVNKNLPQPIEGFSPNATVGFMRQQTGKESLTDIRKAAKNRK